MKVRHNKKRNTAFLYEALIRELTKSIISKDNNKTTKIKKIVKEYFSAKKPLKTVLECYDALLTSTGVDQYTAEKIVFHAKKTYNDLGKNKIFETQSRLIKEINSSLGMEVYDNFVPNYKSLATLAQIFGEKVPLKSRILMEKKILNEMTTEVQQEQEFTAPDSLVVKKFVDRYNSKYGTLLPEQKEFLSAFINSVNEGAIDFRVYLSKELNRIKDSIEQSLVLEDVKSDSYMVEATKKVIEKIKSINISEISDKEVLKILKMQTLVNEYTKNDNQD